MSTETEFPGTGDGGDIFTLNLNDQFEGADMVWTGVAAVLVWIMIPGIGLLYSGISRKKHALSLLWASMVTCCVGAFQWFFWGYSLVFAENGSKFLGTLDNFCLKGVFGAPSIASSVPGILFCFFQGMFACVSAILVIGAICERGRLMPMMVFLFIWMTVVYCPIAYACWGSDGFLANLGTLDFAGGSPVHENAGFSALAYSLILGKRNDPVAGKKVPKYKPHSVTSIVLGTVFLWFGWFGFNGGSTANSSIRSWYACVNTNIAAACGGITWLLLDKFRTGKWSTVGLCSGIICGLVGITPAAGFVPVYFSILFGVVPAIASNYAVDLKDIMQIDDGMDVFALHGVAAVLGNCMTGLFAADYIAASDGSVALDPSARIDGGWINHNYVQLGYQLASSCFSAAWAFTVTSIILLAMNQVPQLKLRLSPEEELMGTDLAQIGELTYHDEEGAFGDDQEPYVLEPIRSTEARVAKLKEASMPDAAPEELEGEATRPEGSDSDNKSKEV